MRSFIASLLFSTLAGCSCGAFAGGGDTVYSRSSDSLILCENGGFVANLSTGVVEGRYDAATMTGVRGDTGAVAFVLSDNPDGTVSTPQLGDGAWQKMALNQTELDHADVQCSDLMTRAWWTP
jgi:hypothetical protein